MKVERARTKALTLLGQIKEGNADPSAEKRTANKARADTVAEAIKLFLARKYEAEGKRSLPEARRVFARYIEPAIGRQAITEVRKSDIIRLLDGVTDNNGPVQANRVLARARSLFRFLLGRDMITSDPTFGIPMPVAEKDRERVLSDAELRLLWQAADSIPYPVGPYLKVLMLTGCRRREASGMQRPEVNEADKLWTVPALRCKGGSDHEVPLSGAALAAVAGSLAERSRIAAEQEQQDWQSVFVTGSRGDTAIGDFSRVKNIIDARIAELQSEAAGKLKARPLPHWQLHDIRRTVRTRLSDLGISPDISEMVIGHTLQGVRKIYDRHLYRGEKARALNIWADALGRIIKPEETPSNDHPPRRGGGVTEVGHGRSPR
jgi:integrase